MMFSYIVGKASNPGRLRKKLQRQGARLLRSEAYLSYAATTREEAQRGERSWTFYVAGAHGSDLSDSLRKPGLSRIGGPHPGIFNAQFLLDFIDPVLRRGMGLGETAL